MRWLLAAGLAAWGLFWWWLLRMQSKRTQANNQLDKELDAKIAPDNRYIDLSAELHVVTQDPTGIVLTPGRPRTREVRVHRIGGIFDTFTRKFVGPARKPLVCYCSEQQELGILHAADHPAGVWLQGGKGTGKSTAGCIWLTWQIIRHAEHPLQGAGVTSPVGRRMEAIRKILVGPKDSDGHRTGGMWPEAWYSWREGDQVAVMITGLSIDFVSAHVSSSDEGSPIQGQNWAFTLNDEIQDYHEANIEIVMRGRSAWGRYARCATATPKQDPRYREFRDMIAHNADWHVYQMRGPDSPFVQAGHWEMVARTTTASQYRREALGEDVASENRTYVSWDREQNLIPLQEVPRWPDVTARELARFGQNFSVLVGSDPGRLHNVSVLLKAFQPPTPAPTRANPQPRIPLPVWFVVGEVTTTRQSTEHHCRALLKVLRERWGCNTGPDSAKAHVRMDPMAKGPNDELHPNKQIFEVFRSFGLDTKAAAYQTNSTGHSWVPKEGRIGLVNIMLCNSLGERRLFVACDHSRAPAAPRLVESLEHQERDGDYRAEREGNKGQESDLSHWPCALGYALWPLRSRYLDASGVAA